jgi:hypothetical protein
MRQVVARQGYNLAVQETPPTMSTAASSHETFTEEEKLAVGAQVERLLATPFFNHSRRFPSFLRYVVNQTLSGNTENLKERTLGIEIFGKSADYDTANDPIVRVTAAEIRKRIAQYYQEPGHQSELRLSLPPGSYVPQFQQASTEAVVVEAAIELSMPVSAAPLSLAGARSAARSRWAFSGWKWTASASLLLVAASSFFAWRHARRSAFDEFWNPVLSSNDPVLFCVADQTQYTALSLRDAADPARQVVLNEKVTAVIIDDLSTITKVAGVLQSAGKHYTVRGEGTTSLMDLRNGPSVIVGAFDNAWTLRLLRPLRYYFANNPTMTVFSIVDSTAPEKSRWVVDRAQQIATRNYLDYAIVARFTDATTGKPALIAAGIGRGGTIAAGEFLTNPDLLQTVRNRAPSPALKNVEVVLSTQIIDDEPGTPKVEAVYFW